MNKTSEDLEREVEDARGRIDRTVEELKDKMHPKEMFDEASRMMSGASNKVLTTAVEQLRENPIPVALIGLGIAWLAIGQTRRTHGDTPTYAGGRYTDYAGGRYDDYKGYDDHQGIGAKLSAGAEAARDKVSRAAEKAKDGFDTARHNAADSVEHARERASQMAHEAQDRFGAYNRAAKLRFDDALQSEPLVIGAIGLAVGAAIGAAMPASDVERRYLGRAREKVVDQATASLDDVKDVAGRAFEQVKEELHRQTGPQGEGSTLAEKAQAVASAGAKTVKAEIEGGAHA